MSEQLNSAQLQAIQNAANKLLQLTLARLQLRKWAVEQALAAINSGTFTANISPTVIAAEIYDFVVKDAVVEVSMIDPEGARSSTPDKPF